MDTTKIQFDEEGTTQVVFDREKIERLRAAYEATDDIEFEFEGAMYYRAYAKYLLEFLEAKIVQN